MKAIKPAKRPNPVRGPLPSIYARTFYFLGRQRIGERLIDFYGSTYVVRASGALERAI